LKPRIFEAIAEIELDIETSVQDIAQQALEHIHSNEIILTMGKSNTIQAFLERAAKKRKFHVIIAENEPYLEEHELALNLSKLGLDITLIPYSAIYSCISRVNKVIISTHSIYANGALKANIGINALALSAKHHNIPLIVCSPLFKLSSDYINSSSLLFNNLNSSDDILSIDFQPNVTVLNPKYDYVSPDLITLFIFNNNSNAPSYVYRLIRELYPSTTDEDL
jgi:translation initiation factor eIF-2B subunit beta